ncbi:B-box zinc finger protein [Archangium lipolyticum]|uniref:B-box zinc finger protein n=1 Tax=Archangium lipolyticum TaxID=2970465 RepID=UPI00214A6A87|nr:B-box zinc finger protein [Archangium lipolyticum]
METAQCPNHPQTTATLTCARCGSFACYVCTSTVDSTLCANCGTRLAPAALDVGNTLQQSFQLLLRHPQALLAFGAVSVAFGLVTMPLTLSLTAAQKLAATQPFEALANMMPAWFGIMIASSIFSAVTYSVFVLFLGDALAGRERPLGELVREGLGRALPMLGLNLVLGIVLGIGFMLCFVPGIFLGTALALAIPAVVLEPAGPIDSLTLSWERTDGHRWNVFFVMLIGGAIFMAVAFVSGIGSLVLQPLGTMGTVVGTTLANAMNSVGITLFLSLLVVCYQRLSGRWSPGAEPR